jgi:23S rRNA pseudouridine2605 synthase
MMRLSRFLSTCGIASRRKADEMIEAGRVKVNGRTVMAMGFRVDPDADKIQFDGAKIEMPKKFRTVILNKPPKVTTTVSDPHAKNTVMQFVDHYEERLFPVGRLDRDSEGLLLFTNDGDLAYRLTHPSFHLDKEYEVIVEGGPGRDDLAALRRGVELDGQKTSKASIRFLWAKNKQRGYAITISEGRKRQIRRMFDLVDAKVVSLKRVRIGPVRIGHLPSGNVREVKGPELKALREAAGLDA